MRYAITFVFMAVALFLAAGQTESTQTQQTSKAEQEVRRLERAWLDAYEQREVEAMSAIIADDFTITFSKGTVQAKAQIIKAIKEPRNPASPPLKFYTEDVRARVYGDTVILIGRVITEWQQNDKTVREQSRYADTYINRKGRWQVVASHLSDIARLQKQ